jgi:hypothetical protein
MRELESVSSRSVVPPPQGFWGDVIGGYAAGALTNVAAGHLAAGMADAEYAAVAIADDLAFGGMVGALGAALNSPLTKSSSADSVLSSRHNGNQRWRWGDQRLFRMI